MTLGDEVHQPAATGGEVAPLPDHPFERDRRDPGVFEEALLDVFLGPSRPTEDPGEHGRQHQERGELVVAEAVDVGEIPGGGPGDAVAQIRNDLVRGVTEHAADDRAAVHPSDRDGVASGRGAEVGTERGPADLVEAVGVLGEHDPGAVAERRLVVFVGGEPEDVAEHEPKPPAHGGVRMGSLAKRPGAVVEAERLGGRATDDDQRVGSRRVARVLDAVARIEQCLGEGEQDRHVLGPAPGHDRIDGEGPDGHVAPRRGGDPEHLPRIVAGIGEERLDAVDGGRHEGVSVAPPALEERRGHLVDRAGAGDVERSRLGIAAHGRVGRRRGQSVDDLVDDVGPERGDQVGR